MRGTSNSATAGEIEWSYSNDIHHPHNADLTPAGTVIIADSDNNRVVEVDRSSAVVWEFSGSRTAERLNWPRDADRMLDGNTLICDSKNSRVLIVSPDKSVLWNYSLPHFANLYEADVLLNGNILISEQQHQRVFEVDRFRNVVWQFRNYVPSRSVYPRINNGSFKRRTEDNLPAGWTPFRRTAEGGGEILWSESDPTKTAVGIKFDRSGAFGLSHVVAIAPGAHCQFVGSLRAEGIREPAAGFLQLSFRDEYGGLFEDVFSAPRGRLMTGDSNWIQDVVEAIAPPEARTVEMRVFITGPGTIWVTQLMLLSE